MTFGAGCDLRYMHHEGRARAAKSHMVDARDEAAGAQQGRAVCHA